MGKDAATTPPGRVAAVYVIGILFPRSFPCGSPRSRIVKFSFVLARTEKATTTTILRGKCFDFATTLEKVRPEKTSPQNHDDYFSPPLSIGTRTLAPLVA